MFNAITNPFESLINFIQNVIVFGIVFTLVIVLIVAIGIPLMLKWFAVVLARSIVLESTKAINTFLNNTDTTTPKVSDLSARINNTNNRKAI